MDRLRHLKPLVRVATLAIVSTLASACDDTPAGPPPKRFASATAANSTTKAARAFCEQSFSAADAKVVPGFPEKPLSSEGAVSPLTVGGRRWINVWATWCKPCIEEMGLIGRWRDALKEDGTPVNIEMWSVDENREDIVAFLKSHTLPGDTRWIGGLEGVPALMAALSLPDTAPIPIHALVDDKNRLRCVRAGAIHDEDYASVKSLLASF